MKSAAFAVSLAVLAGGEFLRMPALVQEDVEGDYEVSAEPAEQEVAFKQICTSIFSGQQPEYMKLAQEISDSLVAKSERLADLLPEFENKIHNSHELHEPTLHLLGSCIVNEEKGRSLLLEAVAQGFLAGFFDNRHLILPKGAPLHELVDSDGNNLVHLAILSGKNAVTKKLLGALHKELKAEELQQLLLHENKEAQEPLDLARATDGPVNALQEFLRELMREEPGEALNFVSAGELPLQQHLSLFGMMME